MSKTFPIFEVPIIPTDLRQEETLCQIADCLDYLAQVTATVFDCISLRISQNKDKINNLQQRISIAKIKVDKLKQVKKATQIFSNSKYPSSGVPSDYISIFNKANKLVYAASNKTILGKCTDFNEMPSIEEKLQFFYVKESQTTHSKRKKNYITDFQKGFDEIPSNIVSVSSLLLFNTSDNPFKKSVFHDPINVLGKAKKTLYTELPNQMEAAPISISNMEQLDEQVKENYFYLPSLGDVPNIDAPIDLPDLPGIADDLKYSVDLDPGFAPSVITTPAIPDLSTLPEDSFSVPIFNENSAQYASNDNISLSQITSPPSPPPPPPPPPPLPPPLPSLSSLSSPNNAESFIVDPLLLLKQSTENNNKKLEVVGSTNVQKNSGDARANLMAAIRNAGGKTKLRPIQSERNENKKNQEEKNLAFKGGDLMADLHNKLLMRRKGISGMVTKDVGSVVSAMDKISAMIPPPAQNDLSSATEDDDWEE